MSPGVGKGGKQEGIGDWARTSPEQCRVYPSTLGVLLPKPGTRGQHPTILSIHVLVRLPAHARLSGWSQEESALSGGGAPDKGLAGLACMSELRLVAYAFGRRLTTRAKEQKEQIVELEQGPRPGKFAMEPLAEKLCKVDITVPSDLASSHSTPCPLNLELWEHDSLLGDSCMLLVPASMPSVAAEVRSLPCGCDGNQDVEEFVADLGRWQRSHQHMATAKSAGVPVGKDTLGGWEAGALLTRQAVVRGLPAVATLLVETLMALPHPSPHPFTHLARAHTHISSGAAADDTAALGGLLHLALLSPCSTTMLWTVLDWGRQWSGEGDSSTEGADFAWNWGEQNAAGDTPLRLLEQLPKGAAVLQLLLEDPEQGPSVKAASQHASRGNGTSLTQAGNSSHLAAASTCPDTTTTTKQLLTLSTGVFQRLQGAFSNSLAHALTLHGSNEPEEAEFRGWVRTQSTPLAKLCFLFNVVHLCTLLLRAVLHKQLHTDIPCLAALLVPYAVAAVASNEAPQTAELLVVLVMLGRLCATLLLSFQLVPIPTSFATVLRLRTEALLEVMVINTMEYVRLSWLLLLRMVLLAGYGLFYRLYGLPYPWLQALGVHAASFLVSCAVDARYRYLFAKRRHKEGTQYEAAPLAGPLATPPAEGAAGTAASATTAQGAAMPAGGEVLEAKGQQKKLPADADEQTGAKNALLQAKPQKPLQASLGSAILACMGKVVLEVINLAFTPLPCVLVAVHLVCEVPVYLKAGHTLPMALFKALSFGLLLWAPPCVLLHTNWWRPLQQLKGRVLQAKAALGAEPQHAPSVTSPTSPSAAGATAAASAAANTEGASQQQQAGSVAEGGNGAGGEQDQPNKLVVVPLYKISDFAAVDNTEESVRSQESNVRSQLEHINQMVQQKHVYTSRFRRYKVDLKIPGQVDHSLLPADALPQIVSLLSERDFTQRITGTAVRHGCIIVSLHMCQEMEQQELLSQQQGHGMQQQQQQQQQEEATQAILAVAQSWLQRTHLADQVPHGTTITLQAGEVQYKLCWQAGSRTWTVDGPLPVHEYEQYQLRSMSHVAMLPPMSQESSMHVGDHECVEAEGATSSCSAQEQLQQQRWQRQQWEQEGRDACDGVSTSPSITTHQCALLPIPFSLHSPTGSPPDLQGWTEAADPVAFAAANPAAGDSPMQQPTSTLSVLACVRGRYLPTQVEPITAARSSKKFAHGGGVGSGHGAAAGGVDQQYQVFVSVPEEVAFSPYPQTLHIELWRSWGMLHSCSSLLIPSSLPDLGTELQALPPQGPEGNSLGVEPFLQDVADWLHQCLGQPAELHQHRRQQQQQQQQLEAGNQDSKLWVQGCILTRQAVLWGLPAAAMLLVETLMALSHPSPNPFMQFARAHTHSSSGAAADDTAALGGLLHLALLSPCSTTMLWTVLDWGRQWGAVCGVGSAEKGFSWDWGELNADGVTPKELMELRADEATAATEVAATKAAAAAAAALLQGRQGVECVQGLLAKQHPEIEVPSDPSPAPRTLAAEGAASVSLDDVLPTPFPSTIDPLNGHNCLESPSERRPQGCPSDRHTFTVTSSFQQLLADASTHGRYSHDCSGITAGGLDVASGMYATCSLSSSCVSALGLDSMAASHKPPSATETAVVSADSANASSKYSDAAGDAAPAEWAHSHSHAHVRAAAECAVQGRTATATPTPALQGEWRNSAAVGNRCVPLPSDLTARPEASRQTPMQQPVSVTPSAATLATLGTAATTRSQPRWPVSAEAAKAQLRTSTSAQTVQKPKWVQSSKRGCAWLLSRVLGPVVDAAKAEADKQQLKQEKACGNGEHHHYHYLQHLDLNAKNSPIQRLMQATPFVQAILSQNSYTTRTSSTYDSTLGGSMLNSPLTSLQCTSTQVSKTAEAIPLLSPRSTAHHEECSAGSSACNIRPVFLPPPPPPPPAATAAVCSAWPHRELPTACQHACNTDLRGSGALAAPNAQVTSPPSPPPFAPVCDGRSSAPASFSVGSSSSGCGSGVAAGAVGSAGAGAMRGSSSGSGSGVGAHAGVNISKGVGGGVDGGARGGPGGCKLQLGGSRGVCSGLHGLQGPCAYAAAAAAASGAQAGIRAYSMEIPGTSANPRRKHHHAQGLHTASAAAGPQQEHTATMESGKHDPTTSSAATLPAGPCPQISRTSSPHLTATAPSETPLLAHRLQGLMVDLGARLHCLVHSSWSSCVWVRHSLCGFSSEQPPFEICAAGSTPPVPFIQQQKGMLHRHARASQHSRAAAGGGSVARQQQKLQQLLLQKCECPAGKLCGTGCLEAHLQQQQQQQQQQELKCGHGVSLDQGKSTVEGVQQQQVCGCCHANLPAVELYQGPCESLEEEYRLWCGRQSNHVAFWYCCFNVAFMLVIMAQSCRGGTLLADIPSVLAWLVPYAFAAVTIWSIMAHHLPQVYAEVALACVILARAISFLSYGASMHGVLGLMPPAASSVKALSWRAELLNELLLGASAEQVRLSWLIALRALAVPPLALYYSGRGCAWPLLQALAVMVLSMASSIRRDICMRRSFLSSRHLTLGLGTCVSCKRPEH